MDDKDLINVETAAQKWGRTPRTIRRWISDGKVKAYRQGGRVLLEPEPPKTEIIGPISTVDKDDRPEITAFVPMTERLFDMQERAGKRIFRWQMMAMTALVTMGIMGSGFYFGWMMYQGQGRELANTKSLLSETRQQLQDKDQRVDSLADEVINALKQPQTPVPKQKDDSDWSL